MIDFLDIWDRLLACWSGWRCLGCRRTAATPLCPACLAGACVPRWAALPGTTTGRVWALGPYDGALREAVLACKFHDRPGLARVLAATMADRGPVPLPDAVLVPIPLHRDRRRQRGYNQAELLARALARRWGRPCRRLLVRPHATPPLHALGRDARRQAVQDAFRVTGGPLHRPVLLVDDVRTTGATLACAAACLLEAGARRVDAVTVAWTP